MTPWLLPLLVGLGCGVLSAWGVGGGTLLLMVMTLLLGVPPETARCINLLYFLPTAAAGLIQHRKNGLLDADAFRAAAPWAVAAAGAGAFLATALDTAVLRRPFGVFLLLCAASLLFPEKDAPPGKRVP